MFTDSKTFLLYKFFINTFKKQLPDILCRFDCKCFVFIFVVYG